MNKIQQIVSIAITILIISLTLGYVAFADNTATESSSNKVEDTNGSKSENAPNGVADDAKKAEGKSKKAEGRSLRSTPEPVIKITHNETLILGKNNKYIVKNLNGAAVIPELERPIAEGDWSDNPADWHMEGTHERPDEEDNLRVGYYNENSIIEIADTWGTYFNGTNIYTIEGITPTVKQIKMGSDSTYNTHLFFLKDTNLNIKSGSLVGMDFSMVPPKLHPQNPRNEIVFHDGAKVNIESDEQGVNLDIGLFTSFKNNNINITTTKSSALPAINSGRVMVQDNSKLIINSKSTTYGIKSSGGVFSLADSLIDVKIDSGVGIEAVGEIDARDFLASSTGSKMMVNVLGDGTGIKIAAKSPNSGYAITVTGINALIDVKVGGTGTGIIIPDKAGSLNFESGVIDITVNDGVGFYSKGNFSVFFGTDTRIFDVKVNKGVAAVFKDMSVYVNLNAASKFSFVSSGASDNTTVFPGEDLPKSAGLVLLVTDSYSGTSISGDLTFVAKAPKDIKDSYGIYTKVLTPFSSQSFSIKGANTEISGDIGVKSATVMFNGTTLKMDTQTNAIIGESVSFASQKAPVDLHGDDVAIKLVNTDPAEVDPSSLSSIYLYVSNSELNITGGNYGIYGVNNNENYYGDNMEINKSKVNIETTEDNSVGIYIKENYSPSNIGLLIKNSEVDVKAVKDGIVLDNLTKTTINASTVKAVADDVAISSNTSVATVGTAKIHGISRKTEPDTIGKKPALYFGTAANGLLVKSGSSEIIEEYLTKSTKQLTETTPYMAYASDRNATIGAANTWNDATDWPYTEARKNIVPSATGLTSVDSGKEDLIVGSMHKDGLKNIINLNSTPSTYKVILRADLNNLVISFNTDGGLPVPAEQYKVKGDKIDAPEAVTKVGHALKHWVDEQGNTWDFSVNTILTNNDMILKAIWDRLTYTIAYEGNVGTTGDTVTGLPSTETVYYGDFATAPANPSRIGYDFDKWTTDAAGQNVFDFATVEIKENKKLYAQWNAKSYDATFDMDGGTPIVPVQPVKYREKIVKPATQPTKTGHKFLGWTKDAAGNTPFDFNTERMTLDGITIYAQWELLGYIVNFDANGGTPAKLQKEFKFDKTIIKPTPDPTKRLYKFDKWYKDKNLTIPFDFAIERMPANEITVYAGWIRTHYEVFFDVNGGSESTKPPVMAVEIGKQIDISKFQPGGANAPQYKGFFLLGWENKKDNSKVVAPMTMGTEDVHLRAMWLSVDGLFTFTGSNSVVSYKNEITKEEVDKKTSGDAVYTDFLGNEYRLDIISEWNNNVISNGGVEKVTLFLKDSTGSKTPINEEIHVYILNRAFINGKDLVVFEQGQQISPNGDAWHVYAYKEMPDFTKKSIVRLPLQTKYLSNGFNTQDPGSYYPTFLADDVDYFGIPVELIHEAEALVNTMDLLALAERKKTEEETDFWVEVAKALHLSKKRENWHIDGITYKTGPSRLEDLKNTKEFDRVVVAEPFSYLDMSAEPLQILKEQDNSRLIVKQDFITWYFDSEDFKSSKIEPTGFYTLRVNTNTSNEKLTQIAKKGNSMQLHFDLNKYWQGKATVEIELDSNVVNSSKKGNNIYLFNFNKDTNELELVGRMKNTTGNKFSIKLNGVFEDYVVMDHLPGSVPKTVTKTTKGTLAKPSGKETTKLSASDDYRITNLTNELDDETRKDIEENLSKRNKTIEQISLVNSNVSDMDKEKSTIKPILIIALIILVLAILTITMFLILRRKKSNDDGDYYDDNSYNF